MAVYSCHAELDIPEKLFFHGGDVLEINDHSWIVEKKIGEGGFGSVYLIIDPKTNQKAAIKILNLYKIAPPEYAYFKSRFQQEYFVGKVKHPNLLHYSGIGLFRGNPYVLMEYCPYGSLQDTISTPKSQEEIFRIAHEIATGLDFLHKRNIIHRDVKPENVLIGDGYVYKITDFGISAVLDQRLTRTSFFGNVENNEVFGSIMYSAPEQLDKKTYFKGTRPTMDIYSYGVLLYNLIFQGKDPFGGEELYHKDPDKYLFQKSRFSCNTIEAESPFIRDLLRIVDKCLQKKPDERFQTMDELLFVLNHISKKEESSASISHLRIKKLDTAASDFFLVHLEKYSKDVVFIGRNKGHFMQNDVNLEDSLSTSKQHATLIRENGIWSIRDGQPIKSERSSEWKNSLNGTQVNGRFLTKDELVNLKPGDQIKIADYLIECINKVI